MSEPVTITCIMPTTAARARFVPHAIQSFLAQDYPHTELVIVDEVDPSTGRCGLEAVAEMAEVLPHQVRVVTLHPHSRAEVLTIGAKRNLAVALARGAIICHWDDDDLYAPCRLSRQAAPILSGEADVTGFPIEQVRDDTVTPPRLWRCSPTLARELFACGIHGGTLMYRQALWCDTAAFANISSGEDGTFLRLLLARGARLVPVHNGGAFIYVRHDPRNAWPLGTSTTQYPHAHEWEPVAVTAQPVAVAVG